MYFSLSQVAVSYCFMGSYFWKVNQRYYAVNYSRRHRHMVHTGKVIIYIVPNF